MRSASLRLSFVLALLTTAGVVADTPDEDDAPPRPREELTRPESTRRPEPRWLKVVDLGERNPKLKGYRAPEGVQVEIVAEAPVVVNPVAMTFADDGTPFVIEWLPSPGDERKETTVEFKYRDGSTRKVAALQKRVKDTIKTLERAGERQPATYGKSKVVLEEEFPSTILFHDGWLYTASRGSVRRHKRSKSDGPLDIKEVVAQGFGGFASRQVSGLAIGNDGLLHISAGAGENHVEGSEGSRATVLRTGAIFRCRPDGSRLELFASGLLNPHRDIAFDAAFNLFQVDAGAEDDTTFSGCRLLHLAERADYGWRSRPDTRQGIADPIRSATFGERPGKMPGLLKTGRGAPSGLHVYNDSFFPEKYRGLIYYPDALRGSVRAYKVDRKGAGFEVAEEFEFLRADDPHFRPCQVLTGPDGAMYVVDRRCDPAGRSPLWGDGKNGRIYRLTWAGTKEQDAIPTRGLDSWLKLARQSDDDLLRTLRSDNLSDRRVARTELIRRGDRNRAALITFLEDADAPSAARLTALGVLHSMWDGSVTKAVRERLSDQDPDLRRLAIDALGLHGEAKGVEAVGLLDDGDLDVRRAAIMALARTGSPGIADTLVNALVADESGDRLVHDALLRGIERQGKDGMERLVALFESGEKKKIDLVADVFLAMRIRPAADMIPRLLAYPHLSVRQRAYLVRSHGNYLLDPPVSLEPLLDYLARHPKEDVAVKRSAVEVLGLGPAPSGDRVRRWLEEVLAGKDEAQRQLRREALRALVRVDRKAGLAHANKLLDAGEPELQAEAILLLGDEAIAATVIGRRFLDGKLPRMVRPEVTIILRRHAEKGNREAAELLEKLLGQK